MSEGEQETMELKELQDLAKQYGYSLEVELMCKRELAGAKADLADIKAETLACALAAGLIDGKNAEERMRQSASTIGNDARVAVAVENSQLAKALADNATAKRAATDAEIGLTKAWLHSQARIS